MKLISVFLILISKFCFADIPYMPIHFTMKTDKQEYYEGETIKFTITLVNSDKQNTYPILIPANQNVGKKLVYFMVFDPAQNIFRHIATEKRELDNHMVHEDARYPEKVYLKPGEEISFDAYLNKNNYAAESSHSFNFPLVTGRYRFYAHYTPYLTVVGDSIYKFYDNFDPSEQEQGYIYFPTTGYPTNACDVVIQKSKSDLFNAGLFYLKIKGTSPNNFFYFINDTIPFIQLQTNDRGIANWITVFDYESGIKWKQLYSFTYFNSGNISQFTKRDESICPAEYYNRTFYNDTLLKQSTDRRQDGTTIIDEYDNLGRKNLEVIYAKGGNSYTSRKFNPKTGRMKKQRTIKGPCNGDVLIVSPQKQY